MSVLAEVKEFSVGDRTFVTGKLDAFQQYHVARRLAPLLVHVVQAVGLDGLKNIKDSGALLIEKLGGIAEALAAMKDEDADYVLKTCLSVVTERMPEGRGAMKLMSNGMLIANPPLEMTEMLQIVGEVVNGNLGNFTRLLPLNSQGGSQT